MIYGPWFALLCVESKKLTGMVIINGGFMKQLLTKKWALSAFLIAALGSQYYFSVSSNTIISVDMSSLVGTEASAEAAKAVGQILVASDASAAAAAPVAAPAKLAPLTREQLNAKKAKALAEGKPLIEGCADCLVLTKAESDELNKQLKIIIEGKKAETAKAVSPCLEETGAAKLRCEREEREEAKREKRIKKDDDEREAKIDRQLQFKEDMEKAVKSCRSEISCVTSRYSSLLGRYSGNKKIDLLVAQAAYRTHIEPTLKAAVSADGSDENAREIIASLSSSVPAEYRAIKENMVATVKTVTADRLKAVREEYVQAHKARSQNNLTEYNRLSLEAGGHLAEIRGDVYGDSLTGQKGYESLMKAELRESDPTTWSYVQSQLIAPVKALFSNVDSLSVNGTTGTTDGTGSRTGRGSRGGGTTVNPVINTGNIGITNPQTLTLGSGGTTTFGAPLQGIQGTRKPR